MNEMDLNSLKPKIAQAEWPGSIAFLTIKINATFLYF